MGKRGRWFPTTHASERWVERVGPPEAMWAAINSSLVVPQALRSYLGNAGLYDPATRALFVVDEKGRVLTCFRPTPGQAALISRMG